MKRYPVLALGLAKPLWLATSISILLTLATTTTRADDGGHHVHGSHTECPIPKTPLEVLRCAQEEHPSVRRAKLAAESSSTLTDAAAQLPNPELEVQSVFAGPKSAESMQSQISLRQPIALGGARGARKEQATAHQKQAAADVRQAQGEVILETVTKLHRLRQIVQERAITDEAIESFTKFVSQYRSRPRLAPEQETSLAVFEMALADNRIKRAVLMDEEREIGHFFHVATGHGLSEISRTLPKAPKTWPKIESRSEHNAPSPSLFRLVADQSLAEAELKSAQAQSWPTLQIGPMIQLQNSAGVNEQLYGFHLVMDLPILSLNGGERAHASNQVKSAERSIGILKEEESHERHEQLAIYLAAIESLKSAPNANDLERKHQRIESLTMRGLISSSLAIEAHRQRSDIEKSRNERELKAIQSLWTLYKLDGRILEESL